MVTSTRYSTDRHNKPTRLIGVSVDSTSRVQAEVSLHESERRFRAIFNGTFEFTELLTIERMVLEVNQTALNFGGLQPQDVVGRPYWEIWWTGLDITDLKQAQSALQEAKQQLEIRLAERSIVLQQINGQLLSEIGDRQIVEEQLRQSQQMLQLIINTIPQCVFWKDRNSVFLDFNPNYARIAGFEKEARQQGAGGSRDSKYGDSTL